MEYLKPALTYEQQAAQLIARGLDGDYDELVSRLRSVSYYRLSGYWFPFRNPDDTFQAGTTLDEVWRRYAFDRRLRVLVLDAIERVEICVRTELAYRLAHSQGPFGYRDAANLPGLTPEQYSELVKRLTEEYERSQEQFIKHFKKVYGDMHSLPPYWVATELMAFGTLMRLYSGSPSAIKRGIAERFSINSVVMESWLKALNTIRNICAHHSRLWNRELGYKPMIPNKDPRWRDPVRVTGSRMFGVLTILKYLLDEVAPQSGWPVRLQALFDEYPEIPRRQMGYPEGWRECPVWTSE